MRSYGIGSAFVLCPFFPDVSPLPATSRVKLSTFASPSGAVGKARSASGREDFACVSVSVAVAVAVPLSDSAFRFGSE